MRARAEATGLQGVRVALRQNLGAQHGVTQWRLFHKIVQYRGVIRISTQPRQKYKILTGCKNRFLYTLLISHERLFHSGTAKKPVYLRSFLLGRIIEIVNSSNLQRRPSIYKEFFAWKKTNKFFI